MDVGKWHPFKVTYLPLISAVWTYLPLITRPSFTNATVVEVQAYKHIDMQVREEWYAP